MSDGQDKKYSQEEESTTLIQQEAYEAVVPAHGFNYDDEESFNAHARIQTYLERLKCIPDRNYLFDLSYLYRVAKNEEVKVREILEILPTTYSFNEFHNPQPFYRSNYKFKRYLDKIDALKEDIAESKILSDSYNKLHNKHREDDNHLDIIIDFIDGPQGKRNITLDHKISNTLRELTASFQATLNGLQSAYEDFQFLHNKIANMAATPTPHQRVR